MTLLESTFAVAAVPGFGFGVSGRSVLSGEVQSKLTRLAREKRARIQELYRCSSIGDRQADSIGALTAMVRTRFEL